jgi:hypothetical protein
MQSSQSAEHARPVSIRMRAGSRTGHGRHREIRCRVMAGLPQKQAGHISLYCLSTAGRPFCISLT